LAKTFQSWTHGLRTSLESLRRSENQLSLVLSLVIGALVGLVVVAFILLTGRLAAHMYPAGGSGWRRVLVPVLGSLSTGYLLWRYFPSARGSGIPQTKFALFIDDGRIQFRTVFGKFFCCSASLASSIAISQLFRPRAHGNDASRRSETPLQAARYAGGLFRGVRGLTRPVPSARRRVQELGVYVCASGCRCA